MNLFKKYGLMVTVYIIVLSTLLAIGMCGSKAITTISESVPLKNRMTVIIDAGHGGIDGGATSCSGALESQINLEIATRLNDLMNLLGMNTLMIRTSDISVYTSGDTIAEKKVSDLKERVRIINETEQCILISIHQNYFSDGRYRGAQVFYAPTDSSDELAKRLQQELIKSVNPGSNRQTKQADRVYLMQNVVCPGVLIECGFLSNPEEEVLLQEEQYQKNLCSVIACVCSSFLSDENQIS